MTFGSQELICRVVIGVDDKLGVRWEVIEGGFCDEVCVGRVTQGGLGEKAGIEVGMKLVSIDGVEVRHTADVEKLLGVMKQRGEGEVVLRRSTPIALPQTPLFGALLSDYDESSARDESSVPYQFNVSSNTSEADTQSFTSFNDWKDRAADQDQDQDPEMSPGSSVVSSCPTSPEFSLNSRMKRRSLTKKKPSLASLVDNSSLLDNGSFSNGSFSDPYAQKARKAKSCEHFLSSLDEEALEAIVSSVSSAAPCHFPKHANSFSSPSPLSHITSCLKGHGASRVRRSVSDAVKHTTWAPGVTTPTTRTGSLPNRVDRNVTWN